MTEPASDATPTPTPTPATASSTPTHGSHLASATASAPAASAGPRPLVATATVVDVSNASALADLATSMGVVRGLLSVLVLTIISFHPWFRAGVERVIDILPLLVLTLIFVYVALPVVGATQRLLARHVKGHVSEERALFMTYIILLGVVAIGLALVVPKLWLEAQALADNLPAYSKVAREKVMEYRDRIEVLLPQAAYQRLTEMMGTAGTYAGSVMQRGLTYVGAFSSTLVWAISAVVVVPMLGYYFLKDADGIIDFQLRLLSPRSRKRVRAILYGMHEAMQNYVRGQAILCGAIGAVTTITMLLILPQFAIGLGIVAGITEAIPMVGPILGAVPAVIIALASKGWVSAVIVTVAYICIQQLESVALVPRVMGEKLGLHPLSLLIGMMFFGNLFGFWGVLLASPLVAAVKVLVTELLEHPAEEVPTVPTTFVAESVETVEVEG